MQAHSFLLALALVTLGAACGGGAAKPETPAADAATEPGAAGDAAPDDGAAPTGIAAKLQGTWEIARFESKGAMPPEAMPIMGEMFDSLRVKFQGGSALVSLGKKAPEKHKFDVEGDSESGFKLVTHGGMFDGAQCAFVGDRELAVEEESSAWPGKTTLKRVE